MMQFSLRSLILLLTLVAMIASLYMTSGTLPVLQAVCVAGMFGVAFASTFRGKFLPIYGGALLGAMLTLDSALTIGVIHGERIAPPQDATHYFTEKLAAERLIFGGAGAGGFTSLMVSWGLGNRKRRLVSQATTSQPQSAASRHDASRRKRVGLFIVGLAVFAWIATWSLGREAVTRHVFETEVYVRRFHQDPSGYLRIEPGLCMERPPYPYYYTSNWSPFPFVVVATYGTMWANQGGHGGRRVYLWLFGPIVSFPEDHLWES